MKLLKNTDNIVKNYYVKVSKYILYNEELRKIGVKIDFEHESVEML